MQSENVNFSPVKVEKGFPDSILYKHDLYRAYIEICHPDEQQHLKMVSLGNVLKYLPCNKWE